MTQICVGLGEEGWIVRNSRCITANPVSHSDWSMESLQVGWRWDWKREISIFSTRRVWGRVGESNLRVSSVINWPSPKIISSSFLERCTKFDSFYVRERKRKRKKIEQSIRARLR